VRKAKRLTAVDLGADDLDPFHSLLEPGQWTDLVQTMQQLAEQMRGRTLWNVNSTARGGGVAEMLASLIPYSRGAGIDERWLVIEGSPEFFDVTKKLHNLLHGVAPPQGAAMTDADRAVYDCATEGNAAALLDQVRPRDVAILHDPQTAGLVPALKSRGVHVVWRSHIGVDEANDVVRSAWSFLLPYVSRADAIVFSRRAYIWDGLDRARVEIIPPCIDPFSAKNRELDREFVDRTLKETGIADGSRFVLQVSRWDRLKDPAGVVQAFAEHVAPRTDACLVLAGPAATSVDDDPEQPQILRELAVERDKLPSAIAGRMIVAQLPMEDVDRNALIVNALQRRADVVVQKSLAEGFGLTVAEAMLKSRPVVASRVGGIEDQVEDGKSGVLIDDPRDLRAFGDAIVGLLADGDRARELGLQARRRVVRWFITPCHLLAQGRLIAELASR
jgi:trehalose synthase